MRIIRQNASRSLEATHKGCHISINREPDDRYYIVVTAPDGSHRYDGWAPDSVRTISDAKKEAIKGACI